MAPIQEGTTSGCALRGRRTGSHCARPHDRHRSILTACDRLCRGKVRPAFSNAPRATPHGGRKIGPFRRQSPRSARDRRTRRRIGRRRTGDSDVDDAACELDDSPDPRIGCPPDVGPTPDRPVRAAVAQLAERVICNLEVGGSSPPGGFPLHRSDRRKYPATPGNPASCAIPPDPRPTRPSCHFRRFRAPSTAHFAARRPPGSPRPSGLETTDARRRVPDRALTAEVWIARTRTTLCGGGQDLSPRVPPHRAMSSPPAGKAAGAP